MEPAPLKFAVREPTTEVSNPIARPSALALFPRPVRLPWLRTRRSDGVLPELGPGSGAEAPGGHEELLRLTTGTLTLTARWLAHPLDGRDSAVGQVQALCESLVACSPHLRLAWVWFGPPESTLITPTAAAGPALDYVRDLRIPRTLLTRMGPAFRAVLGESPEPYRITPHSPFGPWRALAREHAVRSVLALPLRSPDAATRGVMVLYADQDDYFQRIDASLFRALAEVVGAVIVQHAERLRLAEAARRDGLTGLPNRDHASQRLAQLVGRARGAPLSVILLDIDHFKSINDTWGHATGDAVLQRAADVLDRQLRQSDELARWGGEEFVVWLPGTGPADAQRVAAKLRAAMAGDVLLRPAGSDRPVTVSLGVATWRAGESPEALLRRADRAMYRAKAAGRDRVAVDPA